MTKVPRKPAKKATARPGAKPRKPAPARAAADGAAKSAPSKRLALAEVMRILEEAGSAQTRKTWARHGASGPMFGVKFGDLFALMKRIGVDHPLALALWATGNLDARNLAMKIAEPQAITPAQLDRWARENGMPVCSLYVATLAAESRHGRERLSEWLAAADARQRATGWTLLGRLSELDESFPEAELLRRIAEIERSIHAAPGEVRSGMTRALVAIGGRSPALRRAVLAAARRIGAAPADDGGAARAAAAATAAAVEKAWARAGTKFPSPAAHERSMGSMRRRC